MIQIITPEKTDNRICDVLQAITKACYDAGHKQYMGLLGGTYGYGAKVDNDVFMMHPFCWCDQEDCPWCAGCTCPSSAFHYYVDGVEVDYERWMSFYCMLVYGKPEWSVYSKQIGDPDEANKRRSTSHDPHCPYCRGEFGNAPNFHHKPSGVKVWWYKYIGRDMRVEGKGDWLEIERDCIKAIQVG